jgi:hypothetical protein
MAANGLVKQEVDAQGKPVFWAWRNGNYRVDSGNGPCINKHEVQEQERVGGSWREGTKIIHHLVLGVATRTNIHTHTLEPRLSVSY